MCSSLPLLFLLRISLTGRIFQCLSTAGFTVMAATVLPLVYLNEIIAKHQIQLSVEGHWG